MRGEPSHWERIQRRPGRLTNYPTSGKVQLLRRCVGYPVREAGLGWGRPLAPTSARTGHCGATGPGRGAADGPGDHFDDDVTRILSAIEQGDPQAAEQLLPAGLRRAAQAGRPAAGPGEARADAPGHGPGPRGLPPAGRRRGRPGAGTAAATSSPPRPRRCAASSSRTPAASGRRSTAGGRDAVDLDEAELAPPSPRRGPARPRRGPDAARRPRTRQGRAGQAPLLRRPDHRGGRRGRSASPPQRPTAHWAYARAWLARRARGRGRPAGRRLPENLAGLVERIRAAILALPYRGRSRATGSRPMDARRSTNVEAIFLEALEDRCPSRAGGLPRPGLRRRRGAAAAGRAAAPAPTPRRSELPRRPRRRRRRVTTDRRADRRGPRHGHRPLQAAGADRRGGHGRRLHGRADAARAPQGGPEGHQAGHGHEAGRSPGSRPSARPWR